MQHLGFQALHIMHDQETRKSELVGVRFNTDQGLFDASVEALKLAGVTKLNLTSDIAYLHPVNNKLMTYDEREKGLKVIDISYNTTFLLELLLSIRNANCYNRTFQFDKNLAEVYRAVRRNKYESRGIIKLSKLNFSPTEYAIGVTIPSECDLYDLDGYRKEENRTNTYTKSFKTCINKYVGNKSLIKSKTPEERDRRYNEGRQLLINDGYAVIDE